MGRIFPPFRTDIAGVLYVPFVLRDARGQYQDGQTSRQVLRAAENVEIRDLAECLKSQGMQVATDGGSRSYDLLESWEGIRCKGGVGLLSDGELEVMGRVSLLCHPVLDNFVFLVESIAEDVLPKQHMPSPGKLLVRILREAEAEHLKSVYSDLNLLLDDLATAYRNLLEKPYKAGCRHVQSEGVESILADETARFSNRVSCERSEGLFMAFRAATNMLIWLHGTDVYFLNYDRGICDHDRLLWLIRKRETVFDFVLSYYPDEEEPDKLQAEIGKVLNYIPVKHLTFCLPDADNLPDSSEEDGVEQ